MPKKTTAKKPTKAEREARMVARLRAAFSLPKVQARYKKIGHRPTRGNYGGGFSAQSCLIGSFEHAMFGCLIGSFEHAMFGNYGSRHSAIAKKLRVHTYLVHLLEAGFEGWSSDIEDFASEKVVTKKTCTAAYNVGKSLAKKLGLPERG